jgi:hypothetical protein
MGNHNIVANYYKSGPASEKRNRIVEPFDANGKWFIEGNYVDGFPSVTEDNWAGGVQGDFASNPYIKVFKPFGIENIITQRAEDAYNSVLKSAGVIYPSRDKVDERIITEVRNKKVFSGNGIINSQSEVGGYPYLKSTVPPVDSDKDGMPDEWELKRNLNPDNPEDRNSIAPSGYTYIEEYLNDLVKEDKCF